ncbi:cytochrome C oxidase subunit I [Burkholderia sp. Bp9126]|nr:cytochrome C oxidase subunit I [Burkholderia sp. Bp9126]
MTNDGHRLRTRRFAIAAGLVGAPALWFAQMLVSETLAATACYPRGIAQAVPQWPHVSAALGLIAGAAFVLALACAALVRQAWRGTRDADADADADAGPEGGNGDSARFLAQCGALVAAGFVVGLVFTGIVAGFVAPCSPWR